jgi:hypothetical protein
MNPIALAKEINDLLGVESRSLLEHVTKATPYVSAATFRAWREVQRLAHRDSDHAARLSAILARLQLPERPTPFSQDVGHFHYMTVERLMPLLIEERRRQIAAYDRAIDHAGDEAEVVAELELLRADNEAELAKLISLQAEIEKATPKYAGDTRSTDILAAANAAVAARVNAEAKARV